MTYLKDMPHPLEAEPPEELILPETIQGILQVIIVLAIPVVLVLGSVRLVMTEQFLRFEYQRAGFQEDRWGFTTEDRLEYGPYGIRYLIDNRDIDYLADLEIDGQQAFNQRELKHMEDVQEVTRVAFQMLLLAASLLVASMILLARKKPTRPRLYQAIRGGGIFTISLAVFLLLLAVVSWDFFFDTFHAIFFEGDTWLFSNQDTLIRLYPQQFWFDASLLVGLITIIGAGLSMALPWLWKRIASEPEVSPETTEDDVTEAKED